jgi:hypothetical protein
MWLGSRCEFSGAAMAKLQCKVSNHLNIVIGRVEIKTDSRERALEYLIYLARLRPLFTRKDYGEGENNCTLKLDARHYGEDFAIYRENHLAEYRKKKYFFPDALSRGASMYECGYRLSDVKSPRAATLYPDNAWQTCATQLAAILESVTNPTIAYEEMLGKRRGHRNLVFAALFLIEKFPDHHINSETQKSKDGLYSRVRDFENDKDEKRRLKKGNSLVSDFKGYGIDLAGFDDWAEMPNRVTITPYIPEPAPRVA